LKSSVVNAAFRVDASLEMGSGHFMRCLALADALTYEGMKTRFISRHLPSSLEQLLAERGHGLVRLGAGTNTEEIDELEHARWLGTSQNADARDSINALSDRIWNWLVVDHYALDSRWEAAMRDRVRTIMVIDDLADRMHDCDVLLDQNLHADMQARYRNRIPRESSLLLGPKYALLRPEFEAIRSSTNIRDAGVRRVLVCMGGVDASNQTEKAIHAVAGLHKRPVSVDVVIGAQHPARDQIQALCRRFSYVCHVQTANMAKLMACADVAIGAAGISSWERCCLGLPTICVTQARNQVSIAKSLEAHGAIVYLGDAERTSDADMLASLQALMDRPGRLSALSSAAHALVDGGGTRRVSSRLSTQP
jgi:UDP-2,4-diacetamido-2,4,6-trideoxy-beta-L-altropyranose hydrolase